MAATRSAITVRFLTERMPWRLREAFALFGDLTLLGMFGLAAWFLTRYSLDLHQTGETTWILEIPRWPAYAVASACLWVATLIQAAVTLTQTGRMLGAAEPPPIVGEAGAE